MGGRCFFIGHRDAPERVFAYIVEECGRLIEECGVDEFLVGGYGRFDSMAARAVERLRREHGQIKLTRLLAYYEPRYDAANYEMYDGTLYPDGLETTPKRAAIIRANRYAVDMSQYVIAYVWHDGNSRDMLEYAQKKRVVENIAEKYRI